ncbi:MAG: ParA family protein [Sphingomonadaceae bacterium]
MYSMKGGVGKTTLAVSLAHAAATRSCRRTLLWDLDAQGGATWILGAPGKSLAARAREVIERDIDPAERIVQTAVPRLDLLGADASLRGLDALFAELERKKRLRRLLDTLAERYDRIILDCPPGLGPTSEQVIRGVSLILVPVIPSTLSLRAAGEVRDYLHLNHKGKPPLLPLFNMVDKRRALHRATLAEQPDWPAIPMASAVERMADEHASVLAYAPRSAASRAIADLWVTVERQLTRQED